jgi:hypothetical protein
MMEQSATLTVARRTWERLVGQHGLSILPNRPAEGDLLFFPLTGGLFEIKFVKHQDPFYQLGKLYVYKLQVELFQYASEHMQTGIKEIDAFEGLKTFDTDIIPDGTVTGIKVKNKGVGYTVAPTVQIGDNWQPNTVVVGDQEVCVENRKYICTIAGTTSDTAPTHTSSVANDGTAQWQFFGYRAYATAYLGDRPDSLGTVVKILVTTPGSGYTKVPPVYLISNDAGLYAEGIATIGNLDNQQSFGDNNKFKWEAESVIFNEANPFGELETYYTPPIITADNSHITVDSTTITADNS